MQAFLCLRMEIKCPRITLLTVHFITPKTHAYVIPRTDQQGYYSQLYGIGWLFHCKKHSGRKSARIDIGDCEFVRRHLLFVPPGTGKGTSRTGRYNLDHCNKFSISFCSSCLVKESSTNLLYFFLLLTNREAGNAPDQDESILGQK